MTAKFHSQLLEVPHNTMDALVPPEAAEPYQPLLRWRTLTLLVQFDVSLDKVGQVMLYMNGSGAEMKPNTNR